MQTTLAYTPSPEELDDEHFFDSPVLFHSHAAEDDEEPEQGEP